MAQSGLLQWSNDIRRKMASDPGRQQFADQIQTNGFLFLDDYLDNILAGANSKQDGLIDLVKTPSRNRTAPRLPKTASKLKNIVALSFETTIYEQKENAKPLNLFPTIAPAKKEDKSDSPFAPTPAPAPLEESNRSPSPVLGSGPASAELRVSAPSPPPPASEAPAPSPPPAQPAHDASLHVHTETSDLSVIAEDEEEPAERSRTSIAPMPADPTDDAVPKSDSKDSMDGFDTIPLDSPAQPPPPEYFNSERSVMPMEVEVSPISFGEQHDLVVPPSDMDNDAMDITGPLPAPPPPSMSPVPTSDVMDTTEPIPPPSTRQSFTQYHPLPAPQLQKTPGAGLGGKTRSSWLVKSREAKLAHERQQSIAGPSSVNPMMSNAGLKRKSSDFAFGGQPSTYGELTQPFKTPKKVESDVAPVQLRKELVQDQVVETKRQSAEEIEEPEQLPQDDLGQLRKTLEGFKSRSGMGKSLGGVAAAQALAEARAAAEARVNETMSIALANQPKEPSSQETAPATPPAVSPQPIEPVHAAEPRFSVSELASTRQTTPDVPKEAEAVFHKPKSSTSQLSSPVLSLPPADVPVFHKPQPVFRPPSPKASAKPKPLGMSPFSMPASMSLGLAARLPSPPAAARSQPLSKQSTLESVASDSVFDSQGPAWLPSTQDTEYGSQSVYEDDVVRKPLQVLDEDDSWPLDEKLADDNVQWTYGASAEDSMTWSSAPTSSLKLDKVGGDPTGPQPSTSTAPSKEPEDVPEHQGMDVDIAPARDDQDDDDDDDYMADNDISIDPSRMTVNLVNPSKNQSQVSLAESTNSGLGLFPRLYNTLVGKKATKPEVKSLQLAAAAAKKEQEEKDKKATMMKDREARRQQLLQKKAEEEKARALQEEKKIKEENEKRKKEREEHTDKRPLVKPTPAKKDDENNTKKRKLLNPSESKPDLKKATSKTTIAGISKSTFKPSSKAVASSSQEPEPPKGKSSSKPAAGSSQEPEPPKVKSTPASKSKIQAPSKTPGKSRAPPPAQDDEVSQPSMMLQSQMAARAQAQLDAAANAVASESIELPDINSEYSDSEDEEREKYQAPVWAQQDAVERALAEQANIDPDDIFGPIQPLRMEEVFRSRASRFRARTSSANWAGADRLTQEEQADYARRMGFRQ